MKVIITRRGNAYTIHLPQRVVERAGLDSEVEVQVHHGQVVIHNVDHPRAGWPAAAREMARHGDDRSIDGSLPPLTSFDAEEWEW